MSFNTFEIYKNIRLVFDSEPNNHLRVQNVKIRAVFSQEVGKVCARKSQRFFNPRIP